MTTLWKMTVTTIWISAQVAEKKIVEGSDNEDLISLDGDVPGSDLIEYDGFDAREDEEWGGTEGGTVGGQKRKREETRGSKRKKLKSLPTSEPTIRLHSSASAAACMEA